jgi:hypothetical protein
MAEINLERKRGPSAWVWIIALIVLAIILWAIFGHSRTRTASRGGADVVAVSGAVVRTSGSPGALASRMMPAHVVAVPGRAA